MYILQMYMLQMDITDLDSTATTPRREWRGHRPTNPTVHATVLTDINYLIEHNVNLAPYVVVDGALVSLDKLVCTRPRHTYTRALQDTSVTRLLPAALYSHVLRDSSSRAHPVATSSPRPVTSTSVRLGTGRALPVPMRTATFPISELPTTSSPTLTTVPLGVPLYLRSVQWGIGMRQSREGSFRTPLTPYPTTRPTTT